MLPQESLNQLKTFLNVVKDAPQILHTPELAFFKEFIESYGGVIPPPASSGGSTKPPASEEQKPAAPEEEESSEESEIELDNTGVIENPDPEIKDDDVNVSPDVEVSEENIEKANEIRAQAIGQYAEGNYEKAVELFTEAIKLNPGMSLLYVKRGQCYLQLQRPNACIHECNKALSINPDNAAAYKFRGRAHRLLGHWLEAVKDLRNACRIDFDEQADEWLKEVTPNVRKIELYRKTHGKEPAKRKCKPKQEPMRDIPKEQFKCTKRVKPVIRVETVRKSNYNVRPETSNKTKSEANVKAEKKIERDFKRESQKLEEEKRMYRETFFDPEIDEYMNDFEVFSAVLDISSTPMNVKKYLKNRKVMEVLKLMKKKSESRDWHPPRDPEFEKGLRDPEVTQAFLDFRRDGYISKKHNSNPKVVNALNLIANKFGVVPECSSCSAPLFPHSK